MKIINKKIGFLFYFVIILFNATSIFPQAGTLDATFGNGGIALTEFKDRSEAYSVGVQSDNKIVVVGCLFDWVTSTKFLLVRYNSDGSLDSTFGINGISTTPIGYHSSYARSSIIQHDDKILVAGFTFNNNDADFAVIRYKADGVLDSTFGINGISTTPIGVSDDEAFSIALQSDTNIIVAGSCFNGNDWDFGLIRYNPKGSVDSTFGINGTVITDFGLTNDEAKNIAIQVDGKILVAGFKNLSDFALVRYDQNGNLDGIFGEDGIIITDIDSSSDRAYSIALQNDKILLAGQTLVGKNWNFAVVRYNLNGTVDTTFAKKGFVITSIGDYSDLAYSMVVQKDKKILVTGNSYSEKTNDNFVLVRYNSDGSLDTTFGINGIVTTIIDSTKMDLARMVTLQNEKIIVIGYSPYSFGSPFIVVRYNGDSKAVNVNYEGKQPASFILKQNYPNPFNPITTITFTMPQTELVTLKVFDILGKEITTLINEELNAGEHEIKFDAKNLASGVYFYRMKAGSFSETRKFILLR